jgi:cell division protein FtsN
MSKSDEYREMQISSGQLAAVILSLLALCVLIFYLGIRVGMNKGAEKSTLKAQTQTAAPLKTAPVETKPAVKEPKPSGETTPPATVETKAPAKAETKPAVKTPPPPAAESKPKQTAAAKISPTPSGTFYVQVGALDTRPTAETFAQRIEGLGFRAIVLDPFAGDKKTVYRVRVGPYETKEAVETARTKLASGLNRKITDFFIVKG